MSDPALYPCFLGPYGENNDLLERLLVEFLRDHVYWRRNLHPEDPPAIPTHAAQSPGYREFEHRLRRELHSLSAALKRSVPFHSPRYLGHMVSDLLLPGLAAQMLTLPYNPNNVSAEAAPVTIDMELKVGLQLARMFGYRADPSDADCAFGHLTSGGTLANYQGLRLALALKAFPVALRAAAAGTIELPADDWRAFNLTPAASIDLLTRWTAWLSAQPARERQHWQTALRGQRLEQLGLAGFFARHPSLKPPLVLAPVTAHYSWNKGMKLLGLGQANLRLVPESAMRIDLDALAGLLDACRAAEQPVLLAVGVLGSTEFGSIDPVDGLVELRERFAATGLGFAVHIDAAWGGYLATLFRHPDGSLRDLAAMQREFSRFPSAATHAAFAALGQVDSITVDPHKLGYIPYGAGAFVCRDQRAVALLAEDADYVFDSGPQENYFDRFRQLGRYIPEGSKSGAIAAAVYVSHRVLPLDYAHFGRLPAESIRASEHFQASAERFAAAQSLRLRVVLPYAPDSNLVCLALNPLGNRSIATMNRFIRRLYRLLSSDPATPLPSRPFFGSITTLHADRLGSDDYDRILQMLGLDRDADEQDAEETDRLVILRHTLMNPFVQDDENQRDYIQMYFDYLGEAIAGLLPAA